MPALATIGRPPEFRPEFARMAGKACRLGATDEDLAELFDVHLRTVRLWITRHPSFHHAVKTNKPGADDRVQRSLYQRAIGYTFDAVKVFQHEGRVIEHQVREHVPPDTAACIIWLKNRRPTEWRDRRELDISLSLETTTVVNLSGAAALPLIVSAAQQLIEGVAEAVEDDNT